MDAKRPTIAQQLQSLKQDAVQPPTRTRAAAGTKAAGGGASGAGGGGGAAGGISTLPSFRNQPTTGANRAPPRVQSVAPLAPLAAETESKAAPSLHVVASAHRLVAAPPAGAKPSAAGRGGKLAGGAVPVVGKQPAENKTMQQRTELMIAVLQQLIQWNEEVGRPRDQATNVLNDATALVTEAQDLRERVRVSYFPQKVEKDYKRLVPRCTDALREAREAMTKRAFDTIQRSIIRLQKLEARNAAAGAPKDDATKLLRIAQTVLKEEALPARDLKERDTTQSDDITDQFIKAAHNLQMAVNRCGLAMRGRIQAQLMEADAALRDATQLCNELHERVTASGQFEGPGAAEVMAAKAMVDSAHEARQFMVENPDQPELADDYLITVRPLMEHLGNGEAALDQAHARQLAAVQQWYALARAAESQMKSLLMTAGEVEAVGILDTLPGYLRQAVDAETSTKSVARESPAYHSHIMRMVIACRSCTDGIRTVQMALAQALGSTVDDSDAQLAGHCGDEQLTVHRNLGAMLSSLGGTGFEVELAAIGTKLMAARAGRPNLDPNALDANSLQSVINYKNLATSAVQAVQDAEAALNKCHTQLVAADSGILESLHARIQGVVSHTMSLPGAKSDAKLTQALTASQQQLTACRAAELGLQSSVDADGSLLRDFHLKVKALSDGMPTLQQLIADFTERVAKDAQLFATSLLPSVQAVVSAVEQHPEMKDEAASSSASLKEVAAELPALLKAGQTTAGLTDDQSARLRLLVKRVAADLRRTSLDLFTRLGVRLRELKAFLEAAEVTNQKSAAGDDQAAQLTKSARAKYRGASSLVQSVSDQVKSGSETSIAGAVLNLHGATNDCEAAVQEARAAIAAREKAMLLALSQKLESQKAEIAKLQAAERAVGATVAGQSLLSPAATKITQADGLTSKASSTVAIEHRGKYIVELQEVMEEVVTVITSARSKVQGAVSERVTNATVSLNAATLALNSVQERAQDPWNIDETDASADFKLVLQQVAASRAAVTEAQARAAVLNSSSGEYDPAAVAAFLESVDKSVAVVDSARAAFDAADEGVFQAHKSTLSVLRDQLAGLTAASADIPERSDPVVLAVASATQMFQSVEALLQNVPPPTAENAVARRAAMRRFCEGIAQGLQLSLDEAQNALDARTALSVKASQARFVTLQKEATTLTSRMRALDERCNMAQQQKLRAKCQTTLTSFTTALSSAAAAEPAAMANGAPPQVVDVFATHVRTAKNAHLAVSEAVRQLEDALFVQGMAQLGALRSRLDVTRSTLAGQGVDVDTSSAPAAVAFRGLSAAIAGAASAQSEAQEHKPTGEFLDHFMTLVNTADQAANNLDAVCARQQANQLAEMHRLMQDGQERVRTLLAANKAAGSPDDSASAQAVIVQTAWSDLAVLRAAVDRGDVAAIRRYPDAIAAANVQLEALEKAFAAREAKAQASAIDMFQFADQWLTALALRNEAAGAPEDEVSIVLDQLESSRNALAALISLFSTGSTSYQDRRDLANNCKEFAVATLQAFNKLFAREQEAVADVAETLRKGRTRVDKLIVLNERAGVPKDAGTAAIDAANRSLLELEELRSEYAVNGSHPALMGAAVSARVYTGTLPMEVSDHTSDAVLLDRLKEPLDTDQWEKASHELLMLCRRTVEVDQAVAAAEAAVGSRAQGEATEAAQATEAIARLAKMELELAQLKPAAGPNAPIEVVRAVDNAASAILVGTTVKQLYEASPTVRSVRQKFVSSVDAAATALAQAKLAAAQASDSAVLSAREAATTKAVELRQRLAALDASVAAEASKSKRVATPAPVVAKVEAIAKQSAAASEAIAQLASRVMSSATPQQFNNVNQDLSAVEMTCAQLERDLADCIAKAAGVHARGVLADSANLLEAAQRDLRQLQERDAADGKPNDKAHAAIAVADVAVFNAKEQREKILQGQVGPNAEAQYLDAVQAATSMVANATKAMQERSRKGMTKLEAHRRVLQQAMLHLEQLQAANTEAGLPVDAATNAIEQAVRKTAAAQTLLSLVDQSAQSANGLVVKFCDSAKDAADAVHFASNKLAARMFVEPGADTGLMCWDALKRLHECRLDYVALLHATEAQPMLLRVKAFVRVLNDATLFMRECMATEPQILSSSHTAQEHQAAVDMQRLYRGHAAREEVAQRKATAQSFRVQPQQLDEMNEAATKVQSLVRGHSVRKMTAAGVTSARGHGGGGSSALLTSAVPLDRPLVDPTASITPTHVSRVPPPFVVQFVSQVTRSEIAISDARYVLMLLIQGALLRLRNAAQAQVRVAKDALISAEAKRLNAANLLRSPNAQQNSAKPEVQPLFQAAGHALRRAEAIGKEAKASLASIEQGPPPSWPRVLRALDLASHAKAAATEAQALAALIDQTDVMQPERKYASQTKAEAKAAHDYCQPELNRAVALLNDLRATTNKDDIRARHAIQEAIAGVRAAQDAVRVADGALTPLDDGTSPAHSTHDSSSTAQSEEGCEPQDLMQAAITAARARQMTQSAMALLQTAQAQAASAEPVVLPKSLVLADCVGRLGIACKQLEGYEMQLPASGLEDTEADAAHLTDLFAGANRACQSADDSSSGLIAEGYDPNSDTKHKGDEPLQTVVMDTAKAIQHVDGLSAALMKYQTGQGQDRRDAMHAQNIRDLLRMLKDPDNRLLNAMLDLPPDALAAVLHSSQPLEALLLLDMPKAGGHELWSRRLALMASLRARLFTIGLLHKELIADMRRANMTVLPQELGIGLRNVLVEANTRLRVADTMLPSQSQRLSMAITPDQIDQLDFVVRKAVFSVYRFEKELNNCRLVLAKGESTVKEMLLPRPPTSSHLVSQGSMRMRPGSRGQMSTSSGSQGGNVTPARAGKLGTGKSGPESGSSRTLFAVGSLRSMPVSDSPGLYSDPAFEREYMAYKAAREAAEHDQMLQQQAAAAAQAQQMAMMMQGGMMAAGGPGGMGPYMYMQQQPMGMYGVMPLQSWASNMSMPMMPVAGVPVGRSLSAAEPPAEEPARPIRRFNTSAPKPRPPEVTAPPIDGTAMFAAPRRTPPERKRPHRLVKAAKPEHVALTKGRHNDEDDEEVEVVEANY